MRASEKLPNGFQNTVAMTAVAFTLGADTRLVRLDERTGRLAIAADRERCLALLAIVARGGQLRANPISHLEAAAAHWDRGDKALANLRLVFAGLPRIHDAGDAARLRAAEYLLDHGMTPRALLRELDIDAEEFGLEKYDPNQPRVPGGQGKQSGEWTHGLWDQIGDWLKEPVPIFDMGTGEQVGSEPRAWMLATNPLTVVAIGAAALLAADVVVTAAGVVLATATVAMTETAIETAAVDELTPFALRYLTTSGGRWAARLRGSKFMRLLKICGK